MLPDFLSSLKTRIALFASALFMAALWGMAYRSAEKLRDDEEQLLSAQQFAIASHIADNIDTGMRVRIESLGQIASAIDPRWLAQPAKLEEFLLERQAIYRMLDQGLVIVARNGRGLAEQPALGRVGRDYGTEDVFREAVASGGTAIGRPHVDPLSGRPIVTLSAPIGDGRKGVAGLLVGSLTIPSNAVFRAVANAGTMGAGDILVLSPRDGVMVTATEAARTLQPIPPPGANRMHDRAMAGFEGSGVTLTSRGEEVLASVKRVPSSGWFVVNQMPTAQAFAPIREMTRGIYLEAALVSLLVAALTWLFVYREVAALGRAAAALNDMTRDTAPLHPLPVEGSPEIAGLMASFNRLQDRILSQQEQLAANEARFRQMFEDGAWIAYLIDPETSCIVDANPAAADFWGYGIDELRGMPIRRINTASEEDLAAFHAQALASRSTRAEWRHRLKGGEIRDVETAVSRLDRNGRTVLYTIARDITERKLREEREAVRNWIFERLARGGELSELLSLIVNFVERSHKGPRCSILLLDNEGQHLRVGAANELPEFFTAACESLAAAAAEGGRAAAFRRERIVVADIQHHPHWEAGRQLAAEAGIAACWLEPILDSADKVVGTVALYSRQAGEPTAADIDLIEQAANLASIAIEKKRTDAELQLASSVYQASDEAILVADAHNRIIAVNPAFTRVTGYTLDDVQGRDPKLLSSGRTPRAEYETMWQALQTAGQWQGEIWNRRKNGEEYAEWLTITALRNADGAIQRYIAMFSDITEKKRTAELVWRQANYDSLTGLPNRNLFYDRLNQEIKKVQRGKLLLALLYIDLDRFKEVNDALGHDAGDRLLKEAAGRIAACVREADTVARLSGDEFAVVLPGVADIGRVEQVARHIVEHLAQPFELASHPVYVSASVGIALYPNDADSADDLLKSADQAMYAAKEGGRNGFSYYTESMQSAAQIRMQLASSLRTAMAQQQFELYFQPIVDLKSGRVVKAEALLRWRHPEHGLVMPGAFIPLAEEIGLIGEIGDWVFKESARVAQRWYSSIDPANAVHCPIQISVNKSPRQFIHGRDSENWLSYLHRIGLPARYLAVEITEGLLLDDSPEITARLAEYRASGMQVALDDFGTGYSAMSYLNKFRVDYVKIDQSFVQGISEDINDRAIVEAIVAMAHKLRLKVIAEGVETTAQRDFLASIDCDYAQGYLFAKPMPREEFEALLLGGTAILPAARQQ